MFGKVLNNLVDSVDVISEQEKIMRDEQAARQIPVISATKQTKLPAQTNCIMCSDDGLHLFVGHTRGLSVISTSTLSCVRTWQDERVELTSISCVSLGSVTHLLCTVDDMGIARLFVYHMENIYLIKIINETDDINQRNICSKFEVSRSGAFGAAVMMSRGSVWLDVYRFPQDVWLKELETRPGTQSPQTTEAKLSPIVLFMKIKPLEIPAGTSLKSPFEVLEKTEEGTIIGSGQNHLISSQQLENEDLVFRKMFGKSSRSMRPQKAEGPSNCTCHFLLHEGFHLMPGEAKADRDIPIAMCLWWNGCHNLLQYVLKTPKVKDSEPRPDVLWPNSKEILCSSVSSCTRFIVLGLDDQLITIWDRRFGCPYANIVIPGDSTICRVKLLLQSQPLVTSPLIQGACLPTLQLVLTCRSGSCYSVIAGRGGNTNIVALIERPADPGSLVTVAEPLPFLKSLVLLMHRNGHVSVREVDDGEPVFSLNLPQTHVLGSLRPVCVFEPVQQKLYITGDTKRPLAQVNNREEDGSSLFIFSFSECSLLDQYCVTRPAVTEKETRATLSGLEEVFNLDIQERANSWEERSRLLAVQWEQLSKYAVK